MNLDDFVNMVIGGVGELCSSFGCDDYQDHFCEDDIARCLTHCQCSNKTK